MEPHRSWSHQGGSGAHTGGEQRANNFGPSPPAHPSQHSPSAAPSGPSHVGTSYSSYHPPQHSLASLAGLSQSSPRQGQLPRPDMQSSRPPGSGFGLPGLGSEREREREHERAREAEHRHMQEEEERRHREADRQRLEQAPQMQAQAGPPVHIHQPVAVGPRTAHGPNGLLSNPVMTGPPPHSQIGPPQGSIGAFGGGPPTGPPVPHVQQGLLGAYGQGPHGPAAQPQQVAPTQPQQPILNDALSYLDQVKVQFANEPNVYNQFLDIMKDFKSGQIDTPGVINRVSTLFAGNPDLIQGFNTFLPPGYRIECGAGDDPNTIRVTTPMGTTNFTMPPVPIRVAPDAQERPSNGTYTPQPSQPGGMFLSPGGRQINPGATPGYMQVADGARQPEILTQDQRGANSLQNAVTAASGGVPGMRVGLSPRSTPLPGQEVAAASVENGQGQAGAERRGPVEFNHAISYVNKIKTRFAAHPDIYKQFLEILQTYQRESKPIQDVYTQVTQLFKTAPDLLQDFKQFLPESAAHAKAAEQRARMAAEENMPLSNVRGEPAPAYGSPVMSRETHIGTPGQNRGLPPVGNFAPTPVSKNDNKRKRAERQEASNGVEPVAAQSSGKAQTAGQTGKRPKHIHSAVVKTTGDAPLSPTLIPAMPAPIEPTTTSAATSEELAFFDKAKKVIGNKNVMNEFLKLCNLFAQDLIDRSTLMYRVKTFLGSSPDLLKWFSDWVGHDERDIVIENKPRIPTGRVTLSNCRGLGPSYRLLPKRERQKVCSGRDELCNQVLNDEWASHPTWASEDSGFIAHRKNVHEEGLHRIEEERHDYDYNIEAGSRTIQLLEPIATQLRRMDDNAMRSYKLPPNLGGQSETIYKRIIMKLYGRERGHEVIESLHHRPCAVIPVLLNRLKERVETWKIGQREWEKVWRESTQKMFWKSLDHQAVSLKLNERRQFQTKTLQNEIQVKYEEMKRADNANPGVLRLPQMEYVIEDADVIVDAAFLILRFVDETLSTDHPRLAPFIRDFLALFFGLDTEIFRERIEEKLSRFQNDSLEDPASGGEESTSVRSRKGLTKNGNLLRTALGRGRKLGRKEREDSHASGSRASTPEIMSNADDEMAIDAQDETETKQDASATRWLDHPTTGNKLGSQDVNPNESQQRETYRLWANTTIYCFLRLFITFYERLSRLKASEASVRDIVINAQRAKPAIELGIVDKVPLDFFEDTSSDADYYSQMLNKFDACLQGAVEFSEMEDTLRRFYLQCGYTLYGFDKLIASLARTAIQVMNSDAKDKSADIFQAFKKDRVRDVITAQQQTDYRKVVEKMAKEAELYRIDFEQSSSKVKIYLAKKDIPIADEVDEENRWRYYIASYTSLDDTDGVDMTGTKTVFLSPTHGSLPGSDSTSLSREEALAEREQRRYDVKNEERLNIRIAVNNYRAFFQIGTYEGFHATPSERAANAQAAQDVLTYRDAFMKENLLDSSEVAKNLTHEDVERASARFATVLEQSSADDAKSGTGQGEKMDVDA